MSEYYLDDTIEDILHLPISQERKEYIVRQIRMGNIENAYDMISQVYEDVASVEYSLYMNIDYQNWRGHEDS